MTDLNPDRVEFRFGKSAASYTDRLRRRAVELRKKPNELARELVIAALDGNDQQAILEAFSELRDEIASLRDDLGWILGVVFINLGGYDEEAVHAILAQRFKRKGDAPPC